MLTTQIHFEKPCGAKDLKHSTFAYIARSELLIAGFLPTSTCLRFWEHPYTKDKAEIKSNQEPVGCHE